MCFTSAAMGQKAVKHLTESKVYTAVLYFSNSQRSSSHFSNYHHISINRGRICGAALIRNFGHVCIWAAGSSSLPSEIYFRSQAWQRSLLLKRGTSLQSVKVWLSWGQGEAGGEAGARASGHLEI